MKLDIKDNCPINGFTACKKLECAWFIQLRGIDPNSGKDIDEWGCAVAFTPTLLIENALQSRQTGAAVESFRNEMVRANEKHIDVLLGKDTNIVQIPSNKVRNND
tara:strand:+ start:218 stop:532 length:315 start_codon:yes stop_codon:yes gene_type:complete